MITLPPGIDPANVTLIVDLYHGDDVDFHALVAAGVKGVLLKASQGETGVDPRYASYRTRAASVGLLVGAYHFYDPLGDPVKQANHFLAVALPAKGDILPALDSETDGPHVGPNTWACAQAIKTRLGKMPQLYAGDSFFQTRLKAYFGAGQCPLWIARYSSHKPVTTCAMWQFSESVRIPQEPNPLDADIYFGTLADFKAKMLL